MVDVLKPTRGPNRMLIPRKSSAVRSQSEKQPEFKSNVPAQGTWDGKTERRKGRDRRTWMGRKNQHGFDVRSGPGRRRTDKKGANIQIDA